MLMKLSSEVRNTGRTSRNILRRSKAFVPSVIVVFFVATSTHTALAAPLLSVPLRWCAVDGSPAASNPGDVGEADTDGVLWRRHERTTDNTYAPQAQVTFRSSILDLIPPGKQHFPVVPDQDTTSPNTTPGDMLDPGLGETEFNKTWNACVTAWKNLGVGDIGVVTVNIRKFKNADGTDSCTYGAHLVGFDYVVLEDNAFSIPTSPIKTTNTPWTCSGTSGPASSNANDPVDKALGHELGHSIGMLNHVKPGDDASNIMRQGRIDLDSDGLLDNFNLNSSVRDENGSLVNQTSAVHSGAQSTPGCKMAGTNIDCTLFKDVQTDEVGDVAEPSLDISMITATDDEHNRKTIYTHILFEPIAKNLPPLSFFILADLDNNASTGGEPGVLGIPSVFEGAELVTRVVVETVTGELPQLIATPTVWKFQDGTFVQQSDPNIRATIVPLNVHRDGLVGDLPLVHVADSVSVEIPNALRGATATPYRIQALALGSGRLSGIIDRLDHRPGEPGRTIDWTPPRFPVCTVKPGVLRPGGMGKVQVRGLDPNLGVHVLFGAQLVARGKADAAGNAKIQFTVPTDATRAFHLVTVGSDGTALTADCGARICDLDENGRTNCEDDGDEREMEINRTARPG